MNRADAYKFLNSLVEEHPHDVAPMLIDIIVDYLLFPKDVSELSEIQQKVIEITSVPGHTMEAIRFAKGALQCDLMQAKCFVEQNSKKFFELKSIAQSQFVKTVLDKIKVDYNLK